MPHAYTSVESIAMNRNPERVLILVDTSLGWLALAQEALSTALRHARTLLATAIRSGHGETCEPVAPNEHLVDAHKAADALGVKPSWLLQRARERRIPFVRVGKYVRFDLPGLRSWFANG